MTTISSGLLLAGRTALVTGVSRKIGIGYAIAHRLGQLGASLFVQALPSYDRAQYRTTREEFTDVLASLRDIAPRVKAIEADFLDPEAPARVVEAAHTAFGHLDILVANHAYGVDDTLDTLTAESVDRHMQANVRGTLLLVQAYTRQHDGRPGGRVVMMTSGQNSGAMPWVVSYGASKAAIFQPVAKAVKV